MSACQSAVLCERRIHEMSGQCSRMRPKASVMKWAQAAGREQEGQQAHPATGRLGWLVSAAGAGHPCMLMEISGQCLQRMQRPLPHPDAGLAAQLPLFLQGCLKEQPHGPDYEQCTDRTGWRCCQEGKGTVWGPPDIPPERAALARFTDGPPPNPCQGSKPR